VKEFYEPDELRATLAAAGFDRVDVRETPRFLVHGSAVAGEPPLSSRP
jgi:hypothetical protein